MKSRLLLVFTPFLMIATLIPSAAAAGATETPCGQAPAGYNVIISNAERIKGTSGPDFICGGSADNHITGVSGDDIIHGGAGADILHGQDGDDKLYGEGGNDHLTGGDGDDIMVGGPGKDYMLGHEGRDHMNGGANDDELRGGPGNDAMHGRRGADLMVGGRGNDRLRGGLGADTMLGGDDNDILQGQAGRDFLSGNHGRDRLDGRRGRDFCVYGAVMMSCENDSPTDEGIRITYSKQGLDNYIGRYFFLGPNTSPAPEIPPAWDDGVITIVWESEQRNEISDIYRQGPSSPPIGLDVHGSRTFIQSMTRGSVIDVHDFKTGRSMTTTLELDAAATFEVGSTGIAGTAPAGAEVTIILSDDITSTSTERTVTADPDGKFFAPFPDIGTSRQKARVSMETGSGNRSDVLIRPAAFPMFEFSAQSGVALGLGGWTPNSTVEVFVDGVSKGTSGTDADGVFYHDVRSYNDLPFAGFTVSVTDPILDATKEIEVGEIELSSTAIAGGLALSGVVPSGHAVRLDLFDEERLGVFDEGGRFVPVAPDGTFTLDDFTEGAQARAYTRVTVFEDDGDSWDALWRSAITP